MREYEVYSALKVPINSKIIVRLDGRAFHALANNLNLKKPYDKDFYKLMEGVCVDLFKEFGASFIYTFSDEINILLDNIPFNGRVEKLDSVIASFASSSFMMHLNKNIKKAVAFDSRIIPIVDENIVKYFKWRQDESWKNCINSYGIWLLKSKYSDNEASDKIKGLKSNEIHELLFQDNINLNDVDNYKKRGIAIYRSIKKVEGYNKKENKKQVSNRSFINADWNIPIFNEKFFKEINVIK